MYTVHVGAKSSGDIDILLGHPSYLSTDKKKVRLCCEDNN